MSNDFPTIKVKSGAVPSDVRIELNGEDLTENVKSLFLSYTPTDFTVAQMTFYANVQVDGEIGEIIAVHPGCRCDPATEAWEVEPFCSLPHP